MANIQFGTGTAFFVPTNTNAPLLNNPTPIAPTLLQEISFDFKATNKELYGRRQFAEDVARGKVSVSGKCKITATDLNFLNGLYFGMPQSTGAVRPLVETFPTAGGTAQVSKHANFNTDYGVVSAATGVPLVLITSGAPAEGQYSVNAATGTYTFAVGETIASVTISYSWSDTTSGTTVVLSSQALGYGPEFALNLNSQYESKLFSLVLFRCKATDISIPTKQEDYWISDASFGAFANAAGNIGAIYSDQ